jgi:hypothetical protein
MAGLVPAIHVLDAEESKTWMPGTSPGMTEKVASVVNGFTLTRHWAGLCTARYGIGNHDELRVWEYAP